MKSLNHREVSCYKKTCFPLEFIRPRKAGESGPSKIKIVNGVADEDFCFVLHSQLQHLYVIVDDDAVLIADIFELAEVA